MDDVQWFAALDGKESGPFSIGQMSSLIRADRLKPESLVWKKGMSAWNTLASVPEFSHILQKQNPAFVPSQGPAPSAGNKPPRSFDTQSSDEAQQSSQEQPFLSPPSPPGEGRTYQGNSYPQAPGTAQPYGSNPQQVQQAGIPGLVIAGFILAFFCPLVGLILSAIGMGEAKKRQQGKGLALAGIIISALNLLVSCAIYAIPFMTHSTPTY